MPIGGQTLEMIDNINRLLGDDLKETITPGARLKIAASCFSIYAFEALKAELADVESLQFVFTAPTFVPTEVTDRLKKERREFFIPKSQRESGLYGTEFEIQLRNKLTQRAVARECAQWIREKARFRSNKTKAPMQSFVHVAGGDNRVAYMPVNGFTAVDLGYQQGNAVSNFVTRMDEVIAPLFTHILMVCNQVGLDTVEYATLEWVDWFNNRRLLEPIGNIPPAEFEKQYYEQIEESAMVA